MQSKRFFRIVALVSLETYRLLLSMAKKENKDVGDLTGKLVDELVSRRHERSVKSKRDKLAKQYPLDARQKAQEEFKFTPYSDSGKQK